MLTPHVHIDHEGDPTHAQAALHPREHRVTPDDFDTPVCGWRLRCQNPAERYVALTPICAACYAALLPATKGFPRAG